MPSLPLLPALFLLPCAAAAGDALVKSEFIYESAPFPSCHASTIVETPAGLTAAWFGGTKEKHPDVGIWVSRLENGKWTAPAEAVNGVQKPAVPGQPERFPLWNPVLFQPRNAPLMLFYKCGPDPDAWWGMLTTSTDHGKSWAPPHRLPDGITGPVKNKPVQLPGGDLLCASSTEDNGWRIHFERTPDLGQTWTSSGPLHDGKAIEAIQPSILFTGGNNLLAIGRSRQNKLFQVASPDLGKTWGPVTLGTLPNPNSGTDAVTLRDGRHLIVYNHSPLIAGQWGGFRTPLNLAISADGLTWKAALVLEKEPASEFSYPAIVQTSDGMVHITYTWKRKRIKHAVINPAELTGRDMPGGVWPE